jgi:hypothetical protein
VRRLLAYLAPGRDAAGTIYGTIVTGSTIAAGSEGTHHALELAATVVVTVALYWMAHAYAEVLGHSQARVLSWTETRREFFAEWRMVAACILPLAVLMVATMLGASFETATSLALWFAAGLLFVWGLAAAQRANLSAAGAILSALVYTALGVAIVVLKLVFAH